MLMIGESYASPLELSSSWPYIETHVGEFDGLGTADWRHEWHNPCHIEAVKAIEHDIKPKLLARVEKGKPFERMGRKATGLNSSGGE